MSRLLTARICYHLKATPLLHRDIRHTTVHTKTASPVLYQPNSSRVSNPYLFLTLLLGGGVTLYLFTKRENKHPTSVSTTNVYTQHEFSPSGLIGDAKFTRQERNFAENSTYLYRGVLYMSPASFIRLVTHVPNGISNKYSNSVNKVETEQVKDWLKVTSSRRKTKHDEFLKDIWNNGILSYPDYRFLLSTLVKYKHHFEIAFSIYDRDCNGCIELSEFIQVQNSMSGNVPELLDPRTTGVNSSLLVHLFGSDGKGTLSFEEFSRFLDAFQKEVMLFEFNIYAKANKTISFDDFAGLIMRYGSLSLKKVQTRLHGNQGNKSHSLPEFELSQYEKFCHLLLNIEDLSTVLAIYTVTGKGVSKREFNHAVEICCGEKFDNTLLEIIFSLFDISKEGVLNYQEFFDVLCRRQKRGSFIGKTNWELFSTCFRSKVRGKSRSL